MQQTLRRCRCTFADFPTNIFILDFFDGATLFWRQRKASQGIVDERGAGPGMPIAAVCHSR